MFRPFFSGILILTTSVFSQQPKVSKDDFSGLQVMKMERANQELNDETQVLDMQIVDKRGREKEREVRIWTLKDPQGRHKLMLIFDEPRDIKGTGLLTWEQENRDDDQWLYLPSIRREKRIAAGGKKNSFMGTDFAFEDLESENLDRYNYTLKGKKTFRDQTCFVIEAELKDKKDKRKTNYSKRLIWIREDIFFTVQIEYFDQRGNQIKILENDPPRKITETAWRSDSYSMKNIKTGHFTKMIIKERQVNQGLDGSFFTVRKLKTMK